MAWESSQELRPGSRTRHQRGLGFRLGTLCSRSPHLGALEYYGILVTVTAARTLPYPRPRVVLTSSPSRPSAMRFPPARHMLHDARGRRSGSSPELWAHLRSLRSPAMRWALKNGGVP